MTIVSDPEFDLPESDDENGTEDELLDIDGSEDHATDNSNTDYQADDEADEELATNEDADDEEQVDDEADEELADELIEVELLEDELVERSDETAAEFVDRELGLEAAEAAELTEPEPAPDPAPTMEPTVVAPAPTGSWTSRQATSILQRVLAVAVLFGLIGYGLGFSRGSLSTARAEFVYTLDESVPDSFLREDRRLLTQVVTFESDAVLTPVGRQFDLTADQLRAKIDVGTVNLSEFLHLDVTDADPERAVAINRAVLDQYLQVVADASPAVDSSALEETRAEIAAQLTEADAKRLALLAAGERDAVLEARQEGLQRRIDTGNQRINLLRQTLDTAEVQGIGTAQTTALTSTLTEAEAEQVTLETELVATVSERAELGTATTAEPALLREIGRLEAKLSTVDDELADRELAPLVASPIRELSDPIVEVTSQHLSGLQGMAIGLLVAAPIAGLVGYRARRRQLWFD